LRGEGWGEGLSFEFGHERLENSVEIVYYIVVPDSDHTIPERAKRAIALPVFAVFSVLAAVELDYQAPFAANKVDVVSSNRLLADEF
jgi:hypothetical protein